MTWQETQTEYAAAFIAGLVESGVKEVVISPGSRSTPLAMLFADHREIQVYMNIDERSAAYFALGLAKASGIPVALLCTSGTAAANFYPAVIEASLSRVPLIVLTADRPHELRDVGAPQAIDQLHLYGRYVRWFAEMALPETGERMIKYAQAAAVRAVSTSRGLLPGPVHINFPLREPLTPRLDPSPFDTERKLPLPAVSQGHLNIPFTTYEKVSELCSSAERGLIVCGVIDQEGFPQAVLELAEKLNFPVLADPLSQLRSGRNDDALIIDNYDALLKSRNIRDRVHPDLVIHFGGLPVSKALSFLLKEIEPDAQVFIDGSGDWRDPHRIGTHMIHCDETIFCQQLEKMVEKKKEAQWMDLWRSLNKLAKNVVDSYIDTVTDMDEGKAVSLICDWLPPESTVFIGNSMPIRDVDTFFHTTEKRIRLMANRGANGIDGVVSSALGAAVHHRPMFLIIGDLSFFHDMNGLLAAKLYKINITIIVLNNDGGGIFSHLPQAENGGHFELLFGTPTGLNYEHAARMYNGQYRKVYDWDDLKISMEEAVQYGGLSVIEVPTDRSKNVLSHRAMWEHVSQEISKFLQGDE